MIYTLTVASPNKSTLERIKKMLESSSALESEHFNVGEVTVAVRHNRAEKKVMVRCNSSDACIQNGIECWHQKPHAYHTRRCKSECEHGTKLCLKT